jgi:hypothetical protein
MLVDFNVCVCVWVGGWVGGCGWVGGWRPGAVLERLTLLERCACAVCCGKRCLCTPLIVCVQDQRMNCPPSHTHTLPPPAHPTPTPQKTHPMQIAVEAAGSEATIAAEVEARLRALQKEGSKLRVAVERGLQVRFLEFFVDCVCEGHVHGE